MEATKNQLSNRERISNMSLLLPQQLKARVFNMASGILIVISLMILVSHSIAAEQPLRLRAVSNSGVSTQDIADTYLDKRPLKVLG